MASGWERIKKTPFTKKLKRKENSIYNDAVSKMYL